MATSYVLFIIVLRTNEFKIFSQVVWDEHALDFQPPPEGMAPELTKYWHQRYRLFSRFDKGIR